MDVNGTLPCLGDVDRTIGFFLLGFPPSFARLEFCPLPKASSPFYPQALPRGLRVYEGRAEPQLRLHQLRHVQLGLPGPLPPHDPGLLGEPLPAGTTAPALLAAPPPPGPSPTASSGHGRTCHKAPSSLRRPSAPLQTASRRPLTLGTCPHLATAFSSFATFALSAEIWAWHRPPRPHSNQ